MMMEEVVWHFLNLQVSERTITRARQELHVGWLKQHKQKMISKGEQLDDVILWMNSHFK